MLQLHTNQASRTPDRTVRIRQCIKQSRTLKQEIIPLHSAGPHQSKRMKQCHGSCQILCTTVLYNFHSIHHSIPQVPLGQERFCHRNTGLTYLELPSAQTQSSELHDIHLHSESRPCLHSWQHEALQQLRGNYKIQSVNPSRHKLHQP